MEAMTRPLFLTLAALVMTPWTVQGEEPLGTVRGEEPLATLDGEPILQSDLTVTPQRRQLEQQMYEEQRTALNAVIANRVLNKEAEKRGLTTNELIEAEVGPKVGQPTNREITEFYNSQQQRINKPLKEVRDEIAGALMQTKARSHMADFIQSLVANSDLKILIEPPRLPVNLEEVRAHGPEDASVTVVEYADFQCPYCRRVQPVLAMLAGEYEGRVRWVFKDMPLAEVHPEATRAAIAGQCADEQGKFWELKEKLFEQELFTDGMYAEVAKEIGLKEKPLMECMNSGKHEAAVQADFAEAQSFGLDSTPSFLINGILLTGVRSVEVFRQLIDRELGADVLP